MQLLLNKILWKNKNRWQIFGAALGTFLGLLLLLQSAQFYSDLQHLLYGTANRQDGGFVMINKKVNLLNTLGGASTFEEVEIQKIENQSFINSVGRFSSNQFKVGASSQMLGFYTEMFLEALPDEFIDVQTRAWNWTPSSPEVPLIISRDYLALYNFGFAPSQGYPQFTPSTIEKVTFTLIITGKGTRRQYRGRIVGFSDRINSILVPKTFLDYANENFGNGLASQPSRLIVSTDNPYGEELRQFLEENNYEISKGRLIGEEIAVLLQVILTIVAVVGGVIVFLSFLIFLLNFQLIVAESSADIERLMQIGYQHKTIANTLLRNLAILFGTVILLTLVVLIALRFGFVEWVTAQGFEVSFSFSFLTYSVLALFITLFFGASYMSIQRSVIALA